MFDTDFSIPLKNIIKELDMIDDNVKKKVIKSLRKGADVVEKRQKELIRSTSTDLAESITQGRVHKQEDGTLSVSVGYTKDSIAKVGIHGIVLEYGRPGERHKNKKGGKPGITKRKGKNGKEHDMIIGHLNAVPHIRKGYDEVIEEAVDVAVNDLLEEIK